jgi:hypothetical protein
VFRWADMLSTETIVLPVVAMILNLIVIPMLLSQSVLAQESEFLAYENKDFGFSIQYPSDWKKEEEDMSKSSNVNIAVSFVKRNGSQIYSEADFYIRTEEFLAEMLL